MFSDLKNETLKDKTAPGLFVPGSSHQFRTELEQLPECGLCQDNFLSRQKPEETMMCIGLK